jgi:hypothetical protein
MKAKKAGKLILLHVNSLEVSLIINDNISP